MKFRVQARSNVELVLIFEVVMSTQLLAMVLAPLLGLFIVSIGNGFLSSLTTLRLDAAGASATVVGIVSSAYFIGLTLGAVFHDRLIVRIGHIRAYSSFASLIAVSVLLQGIYFDTWFWFFLRLLYGWAAIGVFLVIESWLLLASDEKMRGRIRLRDDGTGGTGNDRCLGRGGAFHGGGNAGIAFGAADRHSAQSDPAGRAG
jgi:MFS family permease